MTGGTRDFQRQRVYDWEREGYMGAESAVWTGELIGGSPRARFRGLPLATCHALVRQVHVDHGLAWRHVTIEDGRGRRRACYQGTQWSPDVVIKLPLWTRNMRHVLHETAHSLDDALTGGTPGHGSTFARVMAELWVLYRGADLDTLLAEAKAARVAVAGHPILPPLFGPTLRMAAGGRS